jgi:hypothetical protein
MASDTDVYLQQEFLQFVLFSTPINFNNTLNKISDMRNKMGILSKRQCLVLHLV